MHWLETKHGRLAYDSVGEGPLVVCAPGMGDLRTQYRALVPHLVAAGFRVVTVDLPGHGDSEAGDPRPEAVGDALVALVRAEGGEAVLVGNSAAAASSVWAAAELGDAARGVVLLGPVARDGMPASLRLLFWALLRVLGAGPWGPALWAWAYDGLYKAGRPDDHEAHLAAVRASVAVHGLGPALAVGLHGKAACAARAGDVTAPVLALLGRDDPDYPSVDDEAAWLRTALSAEVDVLDGVGHYPHLEQPGPTAARVVSWLDALHARAAQEVACPGA
jgi:pimeloyl-ACP methyl ester carboxylesterase